MIALKPVRLHNSMPRAQRGFTLIEVMIVFFVLSVGLLGMAALQMKSMQYNQSSYIRSQATVAAYDILDRMRVNKAIAMAGGYNIVFGAAAPAGVTVKDRDLQEWIAFLANTLPGGEGQITCTVADSQCTIEVRWVDRVTGSVITPMSVTVQM